MLGTLIYVVVVAVVIAFVWWLLDYMPVPEPMNKAVKILSILIGMIIVIYALLGLAGMGPGLSLPR